MADETNTRALIELTPLCKYQGQVIFVVTRQDKQKSDFGKLSSDSHNGDYAYMCPMTQITLRSYDAMPRWDQDAAMLHVRGSNQDYHHSPLTCLEEFWPLLEVATKNYNGIEVAHPFAKDHWSDEWLKVREISLSGKLTMRTYANPKDWFINLKSSSQGSEWLRNIGLEKMQELLYPREIKQIAKGTYKAKYFKAVEEAEKKKAIEAAAAKAKKNAPRKVEAPESSEAAA